MIDASSYSIEIRKGNFEGDVCFQARVKEIPYLEEYAETYEEAYALAIDSIEVTAVAMAEEGKIMPPPAPEDLDFSGRVTLRIPKGLHRYLSHCAEREDVSLNSLVTSVLSGFHGYVNAQEDGSTGYTTYRPTHMVEAQRKARTPSLRVVERKAYEANAA